MGPTLALNVRWHGALKEPEIVIAVIVENGVLGDQQLHPSQA